MKVERFPIVLTIAGSDSGGGAGIQADLKTFQALGCHGVSVITALTAQNTSRVRSVFPCSPEFVCDQIEAVFEDFQVEGVKIGMLHETSLVEMVADCLEKLKPARIVLDPVMVAKSGSPLLRPGAVAALKACILPLADIVTPNLPEAQALTDRPVASRLQMEAAAESLLAVVPAVVLKGGHLTDSKLASDFFATQGEGRGWLDYPRVETRNTHGTGCTYSAAIAAFAARGLSWRESVSRAREYLQLAIIAGSRHRIGKGCGPLDHACMMRPKEVT